MGARPRTHTLTANTLAANTLAAKGAAPRWLRPLIFFSSLVLIGSESM
jgi:hypothetical protein